MIIKYKQIFNLYRKNLMFTILISVFFLSALVSHYLYLSSYKLFAEETFALLFVATLWLAFQIGLMLKRQFASHRASLIPGYRMPHINFVMMLYAVFVLVAYLWEINLFTPFHLNKQGLTGSYLICFTVATFLAYIGYLSIFRLLIYVYIFLLGLSIYSLNIIETLNTSPYLNYLVGFAGVAFLGFFFLRLMRVKEEAFEYPFLLTWPPKEMIKNQLKISEIRFIPFKPKPMKLTAYYSKENLLSRAFHWDNLARHNWKIILLFLILYLPLYTFWLKNNSTFLGHNIYHHFFLLSMTAVLIAVAEHYFRFAYWGYDLLKPVNKKSYFKERGIALYVSLALYWFIVTFAFAIFPNWIQGIPAIDQPIITTVKFWGFIALTGNFAFLMVTWLVWQSCVKNARSVILNAFFMAVIVLFLFYFVELFTTQIFLIINLIILFLGIFLLKKAYKAWYQMEFE